MRVCVCVSVCVCVRAFMRVSACVRACVRACVCVCVHARMCVTFSRMVLMHINVKIFSASLGLLYKFPFVCLMLASHFDITLFDIQ